MSDRYENQTSLAAIFAQVLREKVDSTTIKTFLTRFPTLHDLLQATEEELREVTGIGPAKARKIIATVELARTLCTVLSRPQIVRSAQDIFEFLKVQMMYLPNEHFAVVGLDSRSRILFWEIISVGSLDAAIVHPRECFRPLLKRNAAAAYFIHCHPSGNCQPSYHDVEVTKTLKQAGTILGVRVIDHLVIGFDNYFSIAENYSL
ncbi:DNA repair protein RadC [Brevibacillus gelatini]|uniref:DNA repair protein RadC n=1 Tax=Brevibacillus gelatini TaxID=1655277 RepID=A0A3M8AQS1_9BACL|nr:DNA repair protein RadC [Brevibacillus gelatini]RNB53522.1 DNA repair protein RadC [Brevibacillus gelatini]